MSPQLTCRCQTICHMYRPHHQRKMAILCFFDLELDKIQIFSSACQKRKVVAPAAGEASGLPWNLTMCLNIHPSPYAGLIYCINIAPKLNQYCNNTSLTLLEQILPQYCTNAHMQAETPKVCGSYEGKICSSFSFKLPCPQGRVKKKPRKV